MLEYNMFRRLPSWSQIEVLTRTGTPLAQRQHLEWTITLYTFQHHFVEVWRRADLEIVTSFHPKVNTLAILEPYTEAMDVGDMLDL
jgi:hypothetical protein